MSAYGGVAAAMDRGATWLFQNGSNAGGMLGTYNASDNGGTVHVYTASDDAVGKQQTIIRGCSRFNELIELYLTVDVRQNSYPDFSPGPADAPFVTSYSVPWNVTTKYKLPPVVDREKNDLP